MYHGTLDSTLKGDFTPANATKATVYFQKFNDKLDVAVIDLVGKNKSGNYDDMMIMLLVDKTVQSSQNLTGTYVIDEEYESREENLVNSAIPGIAYNQGGNNYNYIGFWYLTSWVTGLLESPVRLPLSRHWIIPSHMRFSMMPATRSQALTTVLSLS